MKGKFGELLTDIGKEVAQNVALDIPSFARNDLPKIIDSFKEANIPVESLAKNKFTEIKGLDQKEVSQVNEGIDALSNMENIRPEVWEGLSLEDRIKTLQNVENTLAEVQNRPAFDVNVQAMESNVFGFFNGEGIYINESQVMGNDIAEIVDTIAHEGRHAYQHIAVQNPGFHHDPLEVASWEMNFRPENYLDAEIYGQELYESQPIEADAWAYGSSIKEGIYNIV